MNRYFTIIKIAFLILLVVPVKSCVAHGGIEGYLYDPDGTSPVSNAMIVVFDREGEDFSAPFHKDTPPDDNGYFYIPDLRPGVYILDAYPIIHHNPQEPTKSSNTPYISPDPIKVEVFSGKRTKINMRLAIRSKAEKYHDLASENYANYYQTKDRTLLLKGLELIDKAIDADKTLIMAYCRKASILMALEQYQNAILILNEALKTNPKGDSIERAYLFSLRGMIQDGLGKKNSCFEDYSRAIEILKDELINKRYDIGEIALFIQVMFLMNKGNDGLIFLTEMCEQYPKNKVLKERLRLYNDCREEYIEIQHPIK